MTQQTLIDPCRRQPQGHATGLAQGQLPSREREREQTGQSVCSLAVEPKQLPAPEAMARARSKTKAIAGPDH